MAGGKNNRATAVCLAVNIHMPQPSIGGHHKVVDGALSRLEMRRQFEVVLEQLPKHYLLLVSSWIEKRPRIYVKRPQSPTPRLISSSVRL